MYGWMHVCMYICMRLVGWLVGWLVRWLTFDMKNVWKIFFKSYQNPIKWKPKSTPNPPNRSQGVPQNGNKKRKWKTEGVPLPSSPYFDRFKRKMGSKMEPEIDQKSLKNQSKNKQSFGVVCYIILDWFWKYWCRCWYHHFCFETFFEKPPQPQTWDWNWP